jgi:hypothetical protein
LKTADYFDQEITIGFDTSSPLVTELARRPFVTLTAQPDGVEIYENNTRLATAPHREEILTSRTFEFRKANYFSETLTVKGAPPYTQSIELKPFPVITISAAPAVATISRNGKPLGTGSATLPVGEKIALDIRADRYYPQSITLSPESPAKVQVDLKAMPYVTINSDPSGATISIDGASAGKTPVEQLIEKPAVVQLTKDGYLPKTATVGNSDRNPVIHLEKVPPPIPVTTIGSSPAGATVSVNGKIIGITPLDQQIATPITAVFTLEGYHSQTNTLDGSNLTPVFTLEKKTFWQKLIEKFTAK